MFLTVLLIGLALAMDAFSVALSKGLACGRPRPRSGLMIGVVFGGFQFLMPLLGWLTVSLFAGLIEKYSPFISFVLLGAIGIKMIYEALKPSDDPCHDPGIITLRSLLIFGIATSIDALAVGFTFVQERHVPTVLCYCLLIGIVTFFISGAGYFIGGKLGDAIGDKGGVLGGIVLILIGLKMLLGI